jgi:ribosome-associated protein
MTEDCAGLLRVTNTTVIPMSELSFRFSRSSGPGGQHVNRSETRVELRFDLAHTPSLSDEQRERALGRLASYVDTNGVLHLVSQSSRSQWTNREEVVERFRTLMRSALRVPRKRRPTAPSREARERRLEDKRRRGEIKRRRKEVSSYNE